SLLSREEIRHGYVLACQTKMLGDVEVEIPPESRAEAAQILIDVDAQRFRALHPVGGEIEVRPAPLTRKLYLELPRPSLDDSLSDQSRLFRGIRRRRPAPIMQLGLKVVRTLPKLLREADWKVTVTLGWRGGTLEVLQVEPGDAARRNLGIAVDVGTSTAMPRFRRAASPGSTWSTSNVPPRQPSVTVTFQSASRSSLGKVLTTLSPSCMMGAGRRRRIPRNSLD